MASLDLLPSPASSKEELLPEDLNDPTGEVIEEIRRKILNSSSDVRLGIDPDPASTAHELAMKALALVLSGAPDFEKAETLTHALANVRSRGYDDPDLAALSNEALERAYPTNSDRPQTNEINADNIKAHQRAIELTGPDVTYAQALEQAWTELGKPIDSLHFGDSPGVTTQARRKEAALEQTDAAPFNPFEDDES